MTFATSVNPLRYNLHVLFRIQAPNVIEHLQIYQEFVMHPSAVCREKLLQMLFFSKLAWEVV